MLKDPDARRAYAREYTREWLRRNPEKRRAYEKAYRLRHPDKHAEKARRQALRRKYGLELAGYEDMLQTQDGVCAICKRPPRSRRGYRLSVDHDHATGRIRGLLCDWCNTALGVLESPMRAALEAYLDAK